MDIEKAAEESLRKQIEKKLQRVRCPEHGGHATLPRGFKILDAKGLQNLRVCCEKLKAAVIKALA